VSVARHIVFCLDDTLRYVCVCQVSRSNGFCVLRAISPFFVQPVFRDDGYFMLVSQFQKPAHFLLAYLEDYKMDPSAATPLLTFSVFTDYAANKDVALVRCDILNPSIQGTEGRKVVESVLLNYQQDFPGVQTFNERPAHFDFDDYISRMNDRWNKADSSDAAET
jgi:ATP synthase mitochondrial F1 complex assembly factor 1